MTPSVGEDGGQNCHQYRGYAVYDHVITKKLIVGVAETVWLWRLMTDLMNRLHGARDLCPPAFLEISYARRLHPKTYPGPYVGNTIDSIIQVYGAHTPTLGHGHVTTFENGLI